MIPPRPPGRAPETSELCQLASRHDRIAPRYDARWAAYLRETTAATLAMAEIPPGARILDLGCGTGFLLGRLSERRQGLELWGVDSSFGMLRQARAACERCFLVSADAARLPFPDGVFDILVSSSSLHCWREPGLAFREAFRALAPGGRMVITDWCADVGLFKPLAAWLRLTDPNVARIYSLRELDDLVRAEGFAVVHARRYRVARVWGMMTISARRGG